MPGDRLGRATQRMPGAARTALLYAAAARRMVRAKGLHPSGVLGPVSPRPVFVVGSLRSGTTFTAETLGEVPGFVDLGELGPLKMVLPDLMLLPSEVAAPRIRSMIVRSQRLGLSAPLRGVEQTPETTFVIPAVALAFPQARFVHLVRDGRDVACSLLEKGWLRDADRPALDEAGRQFGGRVRTWVEPERREEFTRASEATRAAWAWRRYESAAANHLAALDPRVSLTVRYEDLVADSAGVAKRIARFLDASEVEAEVVHAFEATRGTSKGRWRADLDRAQLADVLAEAGGLLAALGYGD